MDMTDSDFRPLLFSIAYRMTGSVTDSEDLVQETLLRLHQAARRGTRFESRRAYACAVVTRLSIDHLRLARVQREEYVGEWLPEPIVMDRSADPEEQAEMSDSLSMAFLVLLERLTPPERAVFLLREVFGYGFEEIAGLIDKSPANCRQLAVRARRNVQAGRPRFESSIENRWALAERFFAAIQEGDTAGLAALLARDVALYADGGSKGPALPHPLHGADEAARFLTDLGRRFSAERISLVLAEVNGQPGAVALDSSGQMVAVHSLDIVGDRVQAMRAVTNPDKLAHIAGSGPAGGG